MLTQQGHAESAPGRGGNGVTGFTASLGLRPPIGTRCASRACDRAHAQAQAARAPRGLRD